MHENPELTEQEKLDAVANKILSTSKPTEEPPTSTKADLEQKFRIRFSGGNPVFEEVDED